MMAEEFTQRWHMRSRRGIRMMVLAGIVTTGIAFAAIAAGQTATDVPSAKAARGGTATGVGVWIRAAGGRGAEGSGAAARSER